MNILFIGLPLFAEKLKNDLNKFSPQHSFSFCNTYYSKWHSLKFLAALPYADLIISINGAYSQSRALDFAIKMKKKILMHWQGTDALLATEAYKKNILYRKYIDSSIHYTDAPWIQSELKNIGINCSILEYKWVETIPTTHTFHKISAHTYIPQGKESIYGLDNVVQLAEKHFDIDFFVAGTKGKNIVQRKNIHFLGWISEDEMNRLRLTHPIHLRILQHDGYSLSVMKALACGNEVIWTMPHKQCTFISSTTEIETAFNYCVNILKNRGLAANTENILFAKEHLSKEKILTTFLKTVENLVKK